MVLRGLRVDITPFALQTVRCRYCDGPLTVVGFWDFGVPSERDLIFVHSDSGVAECRVQLCATPLDMATAVRCFDLECGNG